ncbi:hypothetical protein M0208_17155 [Sphingomonas sp. SUN019]|uniref:hypothetical protein n=1 Tax=Sphingomonas sp. SUN019 TaxID=2937788 RepID=UPI002164B6E9|nr:hypothetical protein [Sphingomonas sp. SUN019]UVO52154.1 hypothetical protein M0208_17155 [Sphingomonas sp. SUN019]
MNGGTIVGIRAAEADAVETQQPAAVEAQEGFVSETPDHGDYGDGYVAPSPWRMAGPILLVALSAAWVLGLLWLARGSLGTMPPLALAQFAAALATIPALAGIVWLVLLRSSTAEAQRFATTARAMREEAVALEATVAVLTQTLDANLERLTEQSRMLGSLGDGATAKLTQVGRGLSEEIDQADVHARSLAQAAETAQNALSVLLSTMPRAQTDTEALSMLLDRTGLAASQHVSALDAQIVALTERGREAEAVAGGAAQKLAAHMAKMESTSETAGARLESVTADMARSVDALLNRTADAVDESRRGIAAQGDAMLAMVGANQAALDTAARESAESLAERIAIIEIVIDRIAKRLDTQRVAGDGLVSDLEGGLGRVEQRIEALHAQGVERSQMLAASISALGGSADAMTLALQAGDTMATKTIATTETLLLALDAAAREIDETMPAAIDRLDGRVAASKAIVVSAKPELLALVTAAESTHDAIEAIAQVIADQRRNVDTLTATLLNALTSGRTKADAMGVMVDEAAERANRFADEAAPRLIEVLMRVRDTATAAAEHARDTLARVIPEAAEALERSGSAALARAVEDGLDQQIAQIATVAETAVGAASRAADRLDRQIRTIDDAAALLDTRIDLARAEREEGEQDSFARRSTLLIEAMNSAAIDITRSFGPEVADSAWAAYLKGDRGVFTRRAVRLLEATEAREIGDLYDSDPGFRDQVNRYIHDFEAMLRTILIQRDGSSLGVTLLSSDMGKLYVALAQAIERLR